MSIPSTKVLCEAKSLLQKSSCNFPKSSLSYVRNVPSILWFFQLNSTALISRITGKSINRIKGFNFLPLKFKEGFLARVCRFHTFGVSSVLVRPSISFLGVAGILHWSWCVFLWRDEVTLYCSMTYVACCFVGLPVSKTSCPHLMGRSLIVHLMQGYFLSLFHSQFIIQGYDCMRSSIF